MKLRTATPQNWDVVFAFMWLMRHSVSLALLLVLGKVRSTLGFSSSVGSLEATAQHGKGPTQSSQIFVPAGLPKVQGSQFPASLLQEVVQNGEVKNQASNEICPLETHPRAKPTSVSTEQSSKAGSKDALARVVRPDQGFSRAVNNKRRHVVPPPQLRSQMSFGHFSIFHPWYRFGRKLPRCRSLSSRLSAIPVEQTGSIWRKLSSYDSYVLSQVPPKNPNLLFFDHSPFFDKEPPW